LRLKELHLTEGRNTGFKKILDALRQNGSPLPEFETNEDHDYFIARLFVREGFYDYKGGISQHPGDEPVNEPVNEPVKLVYSAVCRNPGIRIPAIVANVGKNTAAVKRAISQLKKLGKVEFRGAPKTGGYYPIEKA